MSLLRLLFYQLYSSHKSELNYSHKRTVAIQLPGRY